MSYRFCNAFCLQHHNFFLPYLVKPTHNQCCNRPPPKQNKGQFCTCSMILYSKFIPPLILLTRAQIPPPKKNSVTLSLIIKGQIIAFNVYDGRRVTERCIGVCNELCLLRNQNKLWPMKAQIFFTYILIPGSSFSRHILLD